MRATGSTPIRIDSRAVAKAEAALAAMSVNFEEWLQAEIARLNSAMSLVQAEGRSEANMEALYHRAHDLKGLGATYGYPIISQIAGTLCRLIDKPEKRLTSPLALVEVHVEAIKAAVRNKITTDENEVGRALVQELEAKVEAFDPEG
ncbi:MAG: Hpt domain-containing protein [Phenylobacterium sp.]|jgi:chemotaxis protein histidine kinase CheA|uniref:Hpt domain-containing protein n=1 Tax=Phenylobacterium sp. TaxID=1871053 RepID=UPI0025DBDC8D|nr:Hpt domain-containing protein [Phenylobacterium sp.]MCA3714092.1 Hpt domain-containing protein [Phenylobacterium sp.]MCA3726942.1 Hpt domain-containing protein [Phenylobacterium sp.]MCA3730227.1 Hpt domain-containing protein [Phenylobacterium sp.]MCA3732901.1 Hpt domain-containing protein [Phenylobacterium sp.]MCA3738845.1 Hpt domain-containing protein [Phenylobacterium sp.]